MALFRIYDIVILDLLAAGKVGCLKLIPILQHTAIFSKPVDLTIIDLNLLQKLTFVFKIKQSRIKGLLHTQAKLLTIYIYFFDQNITIFETFSKSKTNQPKSVVTNHTLYIYYSLYN